MLRKSIFSLVFVCLFGSAVSATPDYFKQFKKDYKAVDKALLNSVSEFAEIKDFVYEKDVATFTFHQGTIYLMRSIDGRPTTAFFLGSGHASIRVPNESELVAFTSVVRDSIIEEDFEFCLIRMADDFDLGLREIADFEKSDLDWKEYNKVMKNQGEYYFKPLIYHKYDNYYQLLHSVYERNENGFFWIDFNRTVFNFDPNRPQEVVIAYEFEGGDEVISEAAVFQRREAQKYLNSELSDIQYESVILEKGGKVEMGGLDGASIKAAAATITFEVQADSIKYLSTFLDRRLKLDSVYLDQQPVGFSRRGSFEFAGIILPDYASKNDTLTLTYYYHGKDHRTIFPFVDNPAAATHAFDLIYPKGYNYFLPGQGSSEKINRGRIKTSIAPANKYKRFYMRGYAAGLDTLQTISDIGLSLNFLKWELMDKKYSDCFIPDDIFVDNMTEAFNFMAGKFGPPPATFGLYLSPAGNLSMPGLMEAPQIACVTEGPLGAYGGFRMLAGRTAARQWFGSLLQPATEREMWLTEALPEFVGLLYIEKSLGAAYYNNLFHRRDSISVQESKHKHMPLVAGIRTSSVVRSNKGLWVLHMLRFMMRDLETHSDATFYKFLRELLTNYTNKPFTNSDFIKRAEKYYGNSLTDFAGQWIYGGQYPKFEAEYVINASDSTFNIDVSVEGKQTSANFSMPVIISVIFENQESEYLHQQLTSGGNKFTLGPFTEKPEKIIFNEFFSIMSDYNLKKK